MKKSILLIGCGRFGKHIAMKLHELGDPVMAIDLKEDRIDKILPFVHQAQIGDATDRDFLESVGVSNFEVCIVAISSDFQSSLETTSLLKELGAKFVVSRANRDVQAKFLTMVGADKIVYPEKQVGNWTAIQYGSDHILDYLELEDDYAIIEIDMPLEWVTSTIQELDIRRRYNINIIGVRKDGKMNMNVLPDIRLFAQDSLLVVARLSQIKKIYHS